MYKQRVVLWFKAKHRKGAIWEFNHRCSIIKLWHCLIESSLWYLSHKNSPWRRFKQLSMLKKHVKPKLLEKQLPNKLLLKQKLRQLLLRLRQESLQRPKKRKKELKNCWKRASQNLQWGLLPQRLQLKRSLKWKNLLKRSLKSKRRDKESKNNLFWMPKS